jgi:23S rRNA pseudouridine1911/1915/1917 synthase
VTVHEPRSDAAPVPTTAGERVRLVVPSGHAGDRADRLVVELLAATGRTVARAEVQRWLDAGLVTRQGLALEKRTTVRAGDALDVVVAPGPKSEAEPDATVTFLVVFEDAHLLVVDKPAGLVVHPARGHRDGTLVNGLLARGGFERASADPLDPDGHLRPGIVHRLDKDTSGLLVVAKDAETREGLKSLFARHDIERAYLAITVGDTRRARWDTTHGRHPQSRLKFTSRLPEGRDGVKRAVTHVEPLRRLREGRATLVRCTLETGRTHQIRVHLAEQARTPILADELYGSAPSDPVLAEAARGLGRQALHAAVLGFVHPMTGERLRWESPLPSEFVTALETLGCPTPLT